MRTFTKTAAALALISATMLGPGVGDAEARRGGRAWSAECKGTNYSPYFQRGMRDGRRSQELAEEFCMRHVPRSVRERGRGAVERFLARKDASHIVSHRNGGSSHPRNLVLEDRSLNRARQGRDMTRTEVRDANRANRADARRIAGPGPKPTPWKPGAGGGLLGFAVGALPEAICGKPPAEIAKRGFWGALIGATATVGGLVVMAAAPVTIPFVAPTMKAGAVVGIGATGYDSYRAAIDPERCAP